MICNNLYKLIGFSCQALDEQGSIARIATPFTFADGDKLPVYACQALDEQGSIARIATPFTFADGDKLPVYVQSYDSQVHRFFDDGQTLLHFIGRGMRFKNGHQLRFLANIAEKHGASLNKNGVIEVFSQASLPQEAFSKFLACLMAVTEWEKEHEDINANAENAAFIAEVSYALLEKNPSGIFEKEPAYLGSSGKKHTLDFKFNGIGYIAIKPSQKSAAPAIYKLVDITNRNTNIDEEIIVVIDDRFDKSAAKNIGQVFRSLSEVVNFSRIDIQKNVAHH